MKVIILCLCSWISAERPAAQEKFRVASGGFQPQLFLVDETRLMISARASRSS
jgi:hypothetical protein